MQRCCQRFCESLLCAATSYDALFDSALFSILGDLNASVFRVIQKRIHHDIAMHHALDCKRLSGLALDSVMQLTNSMNLSSLARPLT